MTNRATIFLDPDVIEDLKIVFWGDSEKRRWYTSTPCVVEIGDKFWQYTHVEGNTELQDVDSNYKLNDDGLVELCEVFPVQKTITVYE